MKQLLTIILAIFFMIFTIWLMASGTFETMFMDSNECLSVMPPITEEEIQQNEQGKYYYLYYKTDNFWHGKIYCHSAMLSIPFDTCRAYCRKIVEE